MCKVAMASITGIALALSMLRFDAVVFVQSLAVPSPFHVHGGVDVYQHCNPGIHWNPDHRGPSVALRSSPNPFPSDANQSQESEYESEYESESKYEYRSIGEVVGGLHGGKYQFGGTGVQGWDASGSDAFSGTGSFRSTFSGPSLEHVAPIPDDQAGEIPNWARKMAPKNDASTASAVLEIPSNANPMDGRIHGASFRIQNQERTWEPFYAKVGVFDDTNANTIDNANANAIANAIANANANANASSDNPAFVELSPSDLCLSIAPSSGVLAPRGGASNACDASKPYSDAATLRIVSLDADAPEGAVLRLRPTETLWLVVGTEEEQWSCRLEFLPTTTATR